LLFNFIQQFVQQPIMPINSSCMSWIFD